MIVFTDFIRGRIWRDLSTLIIVLLAGLGAAHILVRTATYGAAIGYDSTIFLSTAINLLAGEGWRDFMGRPLILWPPLFPLLLAALGWVGIEPLAAGRWINATAFGLTILAAGGWLRSNLQARWLVLPATAIIAASWPLSHWAAHFRTEPLFVLFTLLALVQLGSFLHRGGRTPLLWGAVCTALAALTRYPGVVLIGVGVLLLLVRRAPSLATRLKDVGVFGAIASLPLAVVLTRNWAVSETLTGSRKGTGQSLADGLSQIVDGFREWVIPSHDLDGFGYLLWMAAGLVVAMEVGVVVAGRGRGGTDGGGKARPALPLFGLEPALPFGGFALAYLVFFVAVVPLIIPHGIISRFLLPVYVPLLLAAVLLLDRFLAVEAAGRRAVAKWGLASLVLLGGLAHTSLSMYSNLHLTARALEFGFGRFNVSDWESSETLNYIRSLRDHRMEGRIYSNDGEAAIMSLVCPGLAWFADRTAVPGKYLPIPRSRRWTEIEAGAHIIWFDRFYDRASFTHDDTDFRVLSGVEIVAELADGTVFRRTAAEPFDADRHRARRQRYANQLIHQADAQVRRAGWRVYRTGRRLIYRKKPCAPADVQAKFVLHVVPVDWADLPAKRKQHGFDNLDFYFDQRGERVDDQCMVIVRVPAYAINRIRIGQWIAAENRTLWETEFAPGR